MSRRQFLWALAGIVGAAFAWRTFYVATVTSHETGFYDRNYYTVAAEQLAHGDGFKVPLLFGQKRYEDAEHPPMTVLLLAPVARLTGDSEVAMRLAVALAGVGVVALVGLIGREVAGERVGLLAAGIAAVYPNLWANDGLIMSETFATLFTATAVLFTYRLVRTKAVPDAAAAGAACGLAMLSRSELALLVPVLVLPTAALVHGVPLRRRLSFAGATLLAVALTVGPWIGYNASRFEATVVLSTGDGGAVLGANCDDTYAGERLGFWNGYCATGDVKERSLDAEQKRQRAFDYIGDHLDRLPVVVAARVGRAWNVYRPFQMATIARSEGRPRWVSLTGLWMYWALMPCAAAGVVALRRGKVAVLPIVTPAVIVVVVSATIYGLVRFRSPAEPCIVVLAAVSIDTLLDRSTSIRGRAAEASRVSNRQLRRPPDLARGTGRGVGHHGDDHRQDHVHRLPRPPAG